MATKTSVKQPRKHGPGKYDHLRPEEALRTAWTEEGPPDDPNLRTAVRGQVRTFVAARMPLLWRSIERLVAAEHATGTDAMTVRLERKAKTRPETASDEFAAGYREGVRSAMAIVLEETRVAAKGKGEAAADQYLDEGRLS